MGKIRPLVERVRTAKERLKRLELKEKIAKLKEQEKAMRGGPRR